MTFRSRILLATAPVVLVPLVVFGFGVRRAVRERLSAQYRARVVTMVGLIGDELGRRGTELGERLATLRDAAAIDNQFRLAALQSNAGDRGYLLDYAGTAMRLAGLDMLQIQNDAGRIVSSGHFRNEFDRLEPVLPALLKTAPNGVALVEARRAEAPFLVLARVDSLILADRRFSFVGGFAVDQTLLSRLAPDSTLTVSLVLAHDTLSSRAGRLAAPGAEEVSELPLPLVDESAAGAGPRLTQARLVVATPLTGLRELQRGLDLWFTLAVLATLLVTLLLAGWLSTRVSRPLASLAEKTAAVDVDRLDVAFASNRDDEIGALERLLGEMTERLRVGAARLREAERRATMGELARQVNHDIKNGLAPLRNVLRHLAQVARDHPIELATVFAERRQTLVQSLEYLEKLAANYARLSPDSQPGVCDVNAVVREAVDHVSAGTAEVTLQLADGLPRPRMDPIALRRILENLVSNAVDSLDAQQGIVTISTSLAAASDGGPVAVRLVVEDTGKGMTERDLERAFQDFYTTKPGGTGLGLSIVRRLVSDAGGRLRVDTSPGAGSRFQVEIPVPAGETAP